MTGLQIVAMVGLALIFDFILGEPRNALHPVVWLGRLIGFLSRFGHGRRAGAQFVIGAGVTLVTAAAAATASWAAAIALFTYLPTPVAIVIAAYLLKLTIAPAGLIKAARRISTALTSGDIEAARDGLCSLVSRPTASLDHEQTAAAAVESVSENFTDAVVAPILFFLVLGLPGAWAYRALNTADSMIGYRGEFEWLGKFAARADDVANWVPARVAALSLCIAALFLRLDWRLAFSTMISDRTNTASPNAGWTMAAAAGALGVRLEKPDHYVLGASLSAASPRSIARAIQLLAAASLILVVSISLTAVLL